MRPRRLSHNHVSVAYLGIVHATTAAAATACAQASAHRRIHAHVTRPRRRRTQQVVHEQRVAQRTSLLRRRNKLVVNFQHRVTRALESARCGTGPAVWKGAAFETRCCTHCLIQSYHVPRAASQSFLKRCIRSGSAQCALPSVTSAPAGTSNPWHQRAGCRARPRIRASGATCLHPKTLITT